MPLGNGTLVRAHCWERDPLLGAQASRLPGRYLHETKALFDHPFFETQSWFQLDQQAGTPALPAAGPA